MADQDRQPAEMTSDDASSSSGLPDQGMAGVMRELRGLAHDYLALATLEARLTVNTVLRMVTLAIVTAILLVSAWLALLGAAVLGLIGFGLAPAVAMLLPVGVCLVLAFAGWRRIRQQSLSLGWPATQRAIKPAPVAPSEGVAT